MRPTRGCLALPILFVLLAASPRVTDTPSALVSDPKGWTDLLDTAGFTLEGWVRGPMHTTKPFDPKSPSQWWVDPKTGNLVCEGNGGHEWLRWDKEVGDGIFHAEWRFTPVAGKKGYNAGMYARNSVDAKVWHQAQTGPGDGGFLFGQSPEGSDGKLKGFNLSKPPRELREKPPGEWNTYELTARGKVINLWANGAVVSTFPECGLPKGYFGLEAEGWRVEFRNVKLKTLEK